jgi:hypothetical protein
MSCQGADRPETAGQRLTVGLSQQSDPYALTILIVEAARIADRLPCNGQFGGWPCCPGQVPLDRGFAGPFGAALDVDRYPVLVGAGHSGQLWRVVCRGLSRLPERTLTLRA